MNYRLIIVLAGLIFCFSTVSGQIREETSQQAAGIKALMKNFEFREAVNLADQYLAGNPDAELLLLKGQALEALFQFKEAGETLEIALRADSLNLEILEELVVVYRQLSEPDKAIGVNLQICRIKPQNPFFILQLASLYYANKDYDHSKELLYPFYRQDSSDFYILKQLAYCFDANRQSDSAEYFYRKCLQIDPGDPYITGRLANLLIREDRVNEAYFITGKYLKANPVNPGILQINAYCNYLIHDYAASVKQFRKCLELGDTSKFNLKYLGLSYYKKENYDTAGTFFLNLYLSDTTDSEICFYYGVCKARTNSPDTAIQYLNKTISMLSPYQKFLASVYSELAPVYSNISRADTGLVLLKKALQLDPGNNYILFKIGYQYDYHLRQPQKALPYYREYVKNAPPYPDPDSPHKPTTGFARVNDIPEITGSSVEYAKNRIKLISGK